MAYETGQTSSASDLISKIKVFAAAHGFSVSGDVIYSTNSFTRLQATNAYTIQVLGFGNTAGTAEQGPYPVYLSTGNISWPVTYYFFSYANPSNFFCIVKYGAERHTFLAFGEIKKCYNYPNGGYYNATYRDPVNRLHQFAYGAANDSGYPNGCFAWPVTYHFRDNGQHTFFFRAPYKGETWLLPQRNAGGLFLYLGVSQWNGQTILNPVRITAGAVPNPSNWVEADYQIQDFGHIPWVRHIAVTNYNSGDIITLGPDRWKVFPYHRKNIAENMDGVRDHTHIYGWALSYDGP